MTALAAHSWPGNVRELQDVLVNLTVTGPRYGPVGLDALPSAFRRTVAAERRPTLAEAREDLERAMVRDALGRHGSIARAAGELGVTRQGLSKLMARLQIDRFNPARERPVLVPFAIIRDGLRRRGRTQKLRRRHPSWKEQFAGSDPRDGCDS